MYSSWFIPTSFNLFYAWDQTRGTSIQRSNWLFFILKSLKSFFSSDSGRTIHSLPRLLTGLPSRIVLNGLPKVTAPMPFVRDMLFLQSLCCVNYNNPWLITLAACRVSGSMNVVGSGNGQLRGKRAANGTTPLG